MRDPTNARARPRDKFQLALDGRQVASIVVGAIVVLGVVFVLGLNVGKQIAARQLEGVRAGDLTALDRAPVPPASPEPLTFHDRLTREAPHRAAEAPPAPAPAPATPQPPQAAPAAQAPPGPSAPAPAIPPPPAPEAAPRPWTVQLAAADTRADAERIVSRFASLNPRIEEANVPGKGRFFRVRVGSFETKDAAQRYLRDVARETGAKGIVTPSR